MQNAALTPEIFSRLVLFHQVLDSAPGSAMKAFLQAVRTSSGVEESYLALVRSLYEEPSGFALLPDAWQNHLVGRILRAENGLTLGAARGEVPPEAMGAGAHDLRLLQVLAALTSSACREQAGSTSLPLWPTLPLPEEGDPVELMLRSAAAALTAARDWGEATTTLAAHWQRYGAGLTGSNWFLRWESAGLQPVERPNHFDLDDLVGLTEARATVIRNTEQFLRGRPANNLLLYGQRGTGKSSMVRGLISRYGAEGLRMVEVPRAGVTLLPQIYRAVRRYPQRFVLFLDDLSFDESEAHYKAFKSDMEGALEQRPANVVLYATSNRRHLVPERWTDRHSPETAEVHGQDAMEEKLSLADRFGITVLFTTPDQDEYLAIVEHMAARRALRIDPERLRQEALRWIMWNNPRSGRAARQFLDDLEGRL